MSLFLYRSWTRDNWIDRYAMFVEWLLIVAVCGVAIQTRIWHHWLWWVMYLLAYDSIMWGGLRYRWTKRRMQLRLRIPESMWQEHAFLPRCDIVLESAGEYSRRTAKRLQGVYILAPKEASNLCSSAPALLKAGISRAEAEFVKRKLEEVGAKVEIRQTGDNS